MNTQQYFRDLEKEVRKVYEVANEARAKGLDPVDKVEIPLAMNMAEKVVNLIGTVYPQLIGSGVVERILELEEEYGKQDVTVVFKIAEEVAKQKFCTFPNLLDAIDAGIRIGFAYTTLGVVSSPIEGYTGLKIRKTRDGKEYFEASFSGPIRSAGTTAACVALILIDYLREMFGFAKYDPTEDEIKRTYAELYDFHERITNLQYMPTEEETLFLARNLPIQIAGDPSEKLEVSNYKNLERVDTNYLRSGFCLVLGEGLAQKAAKGFRLLKKAKEDGIKSSGFDFLEKYIQIHEKRDMGKTEDSPTYIKDLVAGRPVFGHPSKSGGFRFRYGRGRVSGFSAVSVSPATMVVTDDFIATGTQLKIEKPTKGCAVTVCDSIDGPIVKLFNGSVRKLKSKSDAKKYFADIEEIIYIGDILFPYSDVLNRNANLVKPGYVEEWWELDLKEKTTEDVSLGINFEKAKELSKKYNIPLHPRFIFYWTEINKDHFLGLIDWLKYSKVNGKLILPYSKSDQEKFERGKRALELLGVEHEVSIGHVILSGENSKALLANLGIDFEKVMEGNLREFIDKKIFEFFENVLDTINSASEFEIKDKAGEFIGARMGRPEKTKFRKLVGSPNVLFPVGKEGGRLRSVQAACAEGQVRSSFPIYYCENCKKQTIYGVCENCNKKTKKRFYKYDPSGNSYNNYANGEISDKEGISYYTQNLDINHYFNKAIEKLKLHKDEIPLLIKGVRGTSSANHVMENLAKGILRARYDLQVNKDGTIRIDATELPLVSFKPKEISVSLNKLKELGYDKDINGDELTSDEQIVELMPHDILLPSPSGSPDERADSVFTRVSYFIDELLERFYGLNSFYNIRSKEDLVGQLGVCMAPHNCAGVICRIIGFSNTQGLLASPYMHAAIRRDCVYPNTNFVYVDEEGIKNEPIGEYVEKLIEKGNRTQKIDSFGTLKVSLDKEIHCFGINPLTKKLKKKKIKYFIKGKPPEKWVKIKTTTGREQIMTSRHKFIYLDEHNNLKSKKADKIKKGDCVAILKNFNFDEKNIKKIFLPKILADNLPLEEQRKIRLVGVKDFFKNLVKEVGRLKILKLTSLGGFTNSHDWYKLVPLSDVKILVDKGLMKWHNLPRDAKVRTIFNSKKWDLELDVNEDLMGLLGFYSAEGYSRQNKTVSQVCFRIMENGQKKKIVSIIKNVFGLKPNLAEDNTKVTICNKLVYYLFKYCFKAGSGAYKKKVPNIVFNVSNNLVQSYLSAYFDGDGTIIYKKHAKFICFYSVSKALLDGISLLGSKFGLFGRFSRTKERLPGKKVLERYKELKKSPKKHILHHLVYSGRDFYKFVTILKSFHERKSKIIKGVEFKDARKRKIKYEDKLLPLESAGDVVVDKVKEVEILKENQNSYCFEVDWESEADKNVLWGEQIINARCDGDESAIMFLMDVLLNFSREFLPSHRGGTQDAPLVLNAKIDAGEVDDQILDFELTSGYPLELYRLAEQKKHSSEVKEIETIRSVLKKGKDPFVGLGYTHDTNNFNDGVVCSSYKTLATMQEKVQHQMELVEKLRAVDTADTARLIIERHFIRDLRGNLRNFSIQGFRCVSCNEIVRRPPLDGVCPVCKGKLIFTTHEGGIKKYLEPAISLAEKYNVSPYIKQNLELVKRYIDSVFGKELEKQEQLESWF